MRTILACLILILLAPLAPADPPRTHDDRLVIERFAAEPDVVTPTGIAVDAKGRVFCIESHTHFRPEGYQGPPADRIRVYEDTDHDGKADRISTFFEGTTYTMSLAFAPDGSLVVATRWEIFRLADPDGDGRAEVRTPLAKLETPGDYPHNGLSGITFDFGGNIYFGLGENLGAPYKLVGNDGTTLSGGGEGGNIYRMRPDGSKLERVATGFWNPFGLAFDIWGRLFAVDNDPDSRPPCRLLHIVDQGDYGYRFRNGRKGLHPFTSWNGELPGTLPMVAGTGEAPSGVIAYESNNLPEEYRGTLLTTSWGDHRIERYRLTPKGASFVSTMEPIVSGGDDFRPVGIAVAPDGSLFISDWVLKDYNLHGKGRIWRLRGTKPGTRIQPGDLWAGPDRAWLEAQLRSLANGPNLPWLTTILSRPSEGFMERAQSVVLQAVMSHHGEPVDEIDKALRADAIKKAYPTAAANLSASIRALVARAAPVSAIDLNVLARDRSPEVRAEALRRLTDPDAKDRLLDALESSDPFMRQAGRLGLSRSQPLAALLGMAGEGSPSRRLGLLLTLRETGQPEARAALTKALADPDPEVRFAAVEWVGEERLTDYRDSLRNGLAEAATTRTLFEAYLAALERLDGRNRSLGEEIGGQDYVAALVLDANTSPAVLRRALRILQPDHPALSLDRLRRFLESDDPDLKLEAVRTLRDSDHPERGAMLATLAQDQSAPAELRAEAIAGLRPDLDLPGKALLDLASDPDAPAAVRLSAARALRAVTLSEDQRKRLSDPPVLRAYDPKSLTVPLPPSQDTGAWLALIDRAGPGDPDEGQRVFFHPSGPGCYRCHRVDGRGGRAGPELTTAAPALDRRRLLESILEPSKEVAPLFVPWQIAREDGTVATGLLVEEAIDGTQTYADSNGNTFTIKPAEIAERRALSTSIMPDDLAQRMTVEELRDLVAFLQGGRIDRDRGQSERRRSNENRP
jgi:putative membrane-bound dehydrogenase-like protein